MKFYRNSTFGPNEILGTLLVMLCVVVFETGCAKQDSPMIHPYRDSALFTHPTIRLDSYKSVQNRPDNNDKLIVAVAISGGGHRAANFGAGVLCGLESLQCQNITDRNALNEVDYFSTVSGGGIAAAAYISSLYSHQCRPLGDQITQPYSFNDALQKKADDCEDCKRGSANKYFKKVKENNPDQITDPCLRRHLERGYHNNMIEALFKPSLWFSGMSRGDLLEDAFSKEPLAKNWTGKDLTLGDIFIDTGSAQEPRLPYWVCNATALENGAIFPFTPDIMECYEVAGYSHNLKRFSYEELKKNITKKDFWNQIPLSVGMAASGAFPVLIDPMTLISDKDPNENLYLHLVDGGVADNLGVMTAIELLCQDIASCQEQDKQKIRMVLIVIDAFPGTFSPYSKDKTVLDPVTYIKNIQTIPLNGWRGRYQRILNRVYYADSDNENSNGVSAIHLVHYSFDDLYQPSQNPFEEDKNKVDALCRLLEEKYGYTPSKENSRSPWEITRGIGTEYNISAEEQSLLLAAGRYIVNEKQKELQKAFGWDSDGQGID